MAFSWRGKTSTAANASGNITLSEPSGASSGDLLIAFIAHRGSDVFNASADWTLLHRQSGGNYVTSTSAISAGTWFYCIRGASAPSYSFTRSGGGAYSAAVGCWYASGSISYDTKNANQLAVASATVTVGSITTAAANSLLVMFGCLARTATASAFDSATDPTTASGATDTTTAPTVGTWIERHDANAGVANGATCSFADAIRATAGATGTNQVTASDSTRHCLLIAAFSEAAGGINGTLNASIGDFGLSATGSLSINGSLSGSIGNFGLSATGSLANSGALSQGIGDFGLSATGSLGIEGALSGAIGDFGLSASGSLAITGALSQSIGDFILDATGETGSAPPANDNGLTRRFMQLRRGR